MSKRHRTPARRAGAVPIGKPFPWGTALGAGALAVLLIGVLAYAGLNAGSAAPNPLRDADAAIKGVQVAEKAPSQNHKAGPLTYTTTPSSGGEHNSTWITCTGTVYAEEVSDENATHSMEHGAVWVTYRPDLPADQVAELKELVEGQDYRLLSPYEGLTSAVSIQAWGRQLTVDKASDPRLGKFADEFTNGPQTPEKGATCSSGTRATGKDPAT